MNSPLLHIDNCDVTMASTSPWAVLHDDEREPNCSCMLSESRCRSAGRAGTRRALPRQIAMQRARRRRRRRAGRTQQVPHVAAGVGDGGGGDHEGGRGAVAPRAHPPQPPQHQRRVAPEHPPAPAMDSPLCRWEPCQGQQLATTSSIPPRATRSSRQHSTI